MCYRVETMGISLEEVADELEATIVDQDFLLATEVNAFERPALPVVLDYNGRKIAHGTWGIIPQIPKNKPAKGLNLTIEKSETLYKNVQHNRCLIPVTAFYEWMHYSSGKKQAAKVKHRIHWQNKNHFYIAGYFDIWDHKEIGFGLLTTKANKLMSEIHNTKMRMPVCLNAVMGDRFLKNQPIDEFNFPHFDPNLVAVNLEPEKTPPTLFG